ncbi:neither inactivation nor afterpotential protein C-like [Frankliniella occidentalis]|uniref:non-specific serine/threonine protein kinase n=1 Tax=Frankliniella occidentalis TaxID=133901 RepID=A0A9C6XQX7_FRAOC|nr:neither inactivation nor afterpotential protein C-like [Frankliniella occidentalis]
MFLEKSLRNEPRGPRIAAGDSNFVVAHYTGKVTYDVRAMAAKNRDFLPPEMIETMRLSNDANIKLMFTNQLSKSGNLTAPSPPGGVSRPTKEGPKKTRWGAALIAETGKCRHYNTESRGQYSQTRRMRTAAATFRGSCLEVLRALAFGPGCGGTHFVRCVRANANNQPRVFQQDLVRSQLRALAVLDTARARQKGYSTRVPFEEFLRRYQFLAFDFDESVEITKDNCRLLLIRLKMEGWVLGKTKVFLKYYHEEYLSRLYEQQVKKIVKVQCMMRAFLAKRNMQTKLKRLKSQDSVTNRGDAKKLGAKAGRASGKQQRADPKDPAQNEAATVIQRNFRGYKVRKEYGPLVSAGGKLDVETAHFIRHYCHKWKAKSMYQVLLLYRAKRYQDFVYFGQQVHMYNQSMVWNSKTNREPVDPSSLESRAPPDFLEAGADHKPNVFKLPFRLQDPLLLGVFSKVDPLCPDRRASLQEDEPWDAPFRPKQVAGMKGSTSMIIGPYGKRDQEVQTSLVDIRGAARDDDRRPSVQFRNGPAAPAFQVRLRRRLVCGGRPAVGPPGGRRPFNPVAELELRGHKTPRHQEDSDDPPFNFQAMLRKTNHGRASLKRRGSGEDYVYNSSSSGGGGLSAGYGSGYSNGSGRGGGGSGGHGGQFSTSPTSPSPSGRRSRSPRPDSPTRRPRDIPSSVRRRPGSLVSAELAPGIVVYGHVADL